MKKLIKIAIYVCLMCGLSSCSTTSPLEMAATLQPAVLTPDQTEVNACRQWAQTKEEKTASRMDSLDSHDRAFAIMHHDTMSMVTNVFGKGNDQCKPGTNVWDAYIVWAKEEGLTKRKYSEDLSSTAKFGIVTTGAVKLADSLMGAAGDKIGGNKVTAGRDSNQAGEGIENSGTNENTTTNVSQVQVTKEGTPTMGSATVTPKEPVTAEPPAEEIPAEIAQ